METVVYVVKYGFIVALVVELALIARAIINVAREKARAAQTAPTKE
ncbi:MAG: hypothetical protein J7463_04540 [Roseiflexus sp.]|nr:hypothetical protein [Roseiflexus sp.]MBO9334561.1 hypothetical protein [Roseiflexus sp.]MBO9341962.1 hypothetical protein [Roseiflexus sp.]MBO9363463.1 hypothetical protein [Roseiflexus sp.]MBO9383394.1 hypothetical protein [Roseiflexus sp.]